MIIFNVIATFVDFIFKKLLKQMLKRNAHTCFSYSKTILLQLESVLFIVLSLINSD